nr:alcohol dehydrogenase catalytic domain-containing protein [Paraburkholderia podalyriae]
MKTVICEQPGQLALAERAMPNAGPDDVLIRIRRVGICGTDFHIFTGNQPYLSYPPVMGHELAGIVESAPASAHVKAGDQVKAMERGLQFVAHGGKYVLVSIVSERISFADPEFHKRETTLLASRNAAVADFETVLDAMRAGKIPSAALNTHVVELADLPGEFPELLNPDAGVIKALVAC